jgi:hypothetical protein
MVVRLAAARSLVRYPVYDRKQLADNLVGMLKGSQDDFVRVGWNVPVDNKRSAAESKSGLSYYPMYWEETAADVLIELGPKYQPSPETLVALLQACPHDGRHLVHVLAMQGDAAKQVAAACGYGQRQG